nr:hypothetical protein [Saprospiraceae bacterium]
MKNLFLYSLLLLSSLFLISCGDDDDNGADAVGTLEIFFEPVYGDSGDLINRTSNFDYPDGHEIRIVVSELFLGDLKVGTGSEEFILSDIEYIDLSDPVLDQSSGLTDKFIAFDNVPAGAYNFLEFGIGVPPALNAMNPSDFGSTNPLSQSSLYWDAWDSYIFSKLEGRMDLAGDGSFSHLFAYHSGGDEVYRILQAQNFPVEIRSGETTRIKLTIDHNKLLVRGADDYMDIENKPAAHSTGHLDIMNYLADNYGSAFTLQLLTD